MKFYYNKYEVWFFLLLLAALYYLFNEQVAMFCFVVFWQFYISKSILTSISSDLKIKKGPFAKGKLIEFKKSETLDSVFEFEGTVEFSWPENENKRQIKTGLNSVQLDKEYTIWIDKNDPDKSIVLKNDNGIRRFSLFFLATVVIGLLYVDYLLLKNIF